MGRKTTPTVRELSDVPSGLNAAGQFLWDKTTESYTLRADELLLLEQACREADLIADIQEAMRFDSLTVQGSQGQVVANPLLGEIRQHRMLYSQLLGRLNLPDLDDSQVSGLRAVPNQQRDAVNSRWHKAYGAGS